MSIVTLDAALAGMKPPYFFSKVTPGTPVIGTYAVIADGSIYTVFPS